MRNQQAIIKRESKTGEELIHPASAPFQDGFLRLGWGETLCYTRRQSWGVADEQATVLVLFHTGY
jgi:hypothetical protein